MFSGAIFRREAFAVARRPRTYVLQTVFLAGLVCILIALWPSGKVDGETVSGSGRQIFEYGTLLEVILVALLAPAATASVITVEKSKNTLGLLLLTDAGPTAIVLEKLLARTAALAFLLLLSMPVIFAVLTLGGIDARSIGIAYVILLSFGFAGGALGIFFSTIMRKTPGALMGGYFCVGTYLFLPDLLEAYGALARKGARGAGTIDPRAAWLSPLYDALYLFDPSHFVATESFPQSWWINPAINIAAGVFLVLVSGLILPKSKEIEKALDPRRLLGFGPRGEEVDASASDPSGQWKALTITGTVLVALFGRTGFRVYVQHRKLEEVLRTDLPIVLVAIVAGVIALALFNRVLARRAKDTRAETREGPTGNPIYWKETTVNTLGRWALWWRLNLLLVLGLVGSYWLFRDQLSDIKFHQVVAAVLSSILILASTVLSANAVAKEREERTLEVLSTTPIDCATYVQGKVGGILRNIIFLLLMPLGHVVMFTAVGPIHPVSLVICLAFPIAAIVSILQGILVSLMMPTTIRALIAAIIVVVLEAALPFCCCLPSFNLPLLGYYAIADGSRDFEWALFLGTLFSTAAHGGLMLVVYSLIRSGFDRYIGRAG